MISIEERIERAGQHVVRARLYFDLWQYLEMQKGMPTRLNVINQFADFFRFDSHAHFIAFLLYIAGLFESRDDTINFGHLMRDLLAAHLIIEPLVAEIESLFGQAQPLAKKAMILRSNAIAHRSASMSLDAVFKKAKTTPNQLRELTELALKIANHFLIATNRKQQFFRDVPRAHLEGIMEILEANPI